MMYMITYGPVPEKMDICHKCDNRSCINPTHLFLGTRSENMIDMVEKGRFNYDRRWASGDEHHTRRHPECIKNRKVTPEIGEMLLKETGSVREIAKKYGLGHTTVRTALKKYGSQDKDQVIAERR